MDFVVYKNMHKAKSKLLNGIFYAFSFSLGALLTFLLLQQQNYVTDESCGDNISTHSASCLSDDQVLSELRNRVKSLDSLISEAMKLETYLPTQKNIKSRNIGLGIGGGKASKSLIISNYKTPNFSDVSNLNSRDLLARIDSQIDYISSLPIGAPVAGEISSYFGRRYLTHGKDGHSGLDIAASKNTPVRATADGIVLLAGWNGDYGKSVIIKHNHRIETLYGHLSKVLVKNGQNIKRGDVIGLLGSTGRSTGPHLHYEVRLGGIPRDPLPFIYLVRDLRNITKS